MLVPLLLLLLLLLLPERERLEGRDPEGVPTVRRRRDRQDILP